MSAEEFAIAIKGTPEQLNCKTAHQLLWEAHTRFKSVTSFRELVRDIEDKDVQR